MLDVSKNNMVQFLKLPCIQFCQSITEKYILLLVFIYELYTGLDRRGVWTLYKWIWAPEFGHTHKKRDNFLFKAVLDVFWSAEFISEVHFCSKKFAQPARNLPCLPVHNCSEQLIGLWVNTGDWLLGVCWPYYCFITADELTHTKDVQMLSQTICAAMSNLKSHAVRCFGQHLVKSALKKTQPGGCDELIFVVLTHQGQPPIKISHCTHTTEESRWVLHSYSECSHLWNLRAHIARWCAEISHPHRTINLIFL